MELAQKLSILADAAKYDASCASSGAGKRHSLGKSGGVGSTEGMGICHSYTPDGRCVSLLKILVTNVCIFDCVYCINRRSSDTRRARFTPQEVVRLTLDFYKRNYIEGLFLSSGIIRNGDYTMEQLVQVARALRDDHQFRGYIHLKTIPDASPDLLAEAGRYADRLSINVELPTETGLQQLAPEKNLPRIRKAMGELRWRIEDNQEQRRAVSRAKQPKFAPAGQSTQMIVGADAADDRAILECSTGLYGNYRLRRVYYSAFSPIPDASALLPLKAPPLVREHRLYQADWLLRFYQFEWEELFAVDASTHGGTGSSGMLDLDIDPKLAWALRNPQRFPVDINNAPKELLLRVPGLGVRNVKRLLGARRHGVIRLPDLVRLRVSLKKAMPFIVLPDHRPRDLDNDPLRLRALLAPPPRQARLFA